MKTPVTCKSGGEGKNTICGRQMVVRHYRNKYGKPDYLHLCERCDGLPLMPSKRSVA